MSIECIEAPICRNTGKVIQYRGHTGARGVSNNRIPSLVKYAKSSLEKAGVDYKSIPVITYKGTEAEWEKEGFTIARTRDGEQIHFWNCVGLDCLNGQDIIVAGKPDKPNDFYLDIWFDYKDIHKIEDNEPPHRVNQRVTRYGATDCMFLWDKPILRDIQLEQMEYLVEQAIGRARVLRTPATVYYFSNLTTQSVDEIHD